MCKVSLSVYNRHSSSEDKLRMRPDFRVNNSPCHYNKLLPQDCSTGTVRNHSEFQGADHYITTQLVPPKIVRDISPLDDLLNIFLDKMLTRCGGLNATRKTFKIFDIAGNGMITFDEFKKSINTMCIHSVDINTDIEQQLYHMLSMEHDGVRYITYSSFKRIIDADNDINKTYF
jgi:hypothetical protein